MEGWPACDVALVTEGSGPVGGQADPDDRRRNVIVLTTVRRRTLKKRMPRTHDAISVPTPVLPGKPIHLQVADQPTPVVNDALDARPEWFYRVPDRPDPGELGGTAMKGHVARKRDRYYAVTYEGMTPSTARRGRAEPLPAPTALKPKPSPPASRPNATAATRRSARSPSAPTSRVGGSQPRSSSGEQARTCQNRVNSSYSQPAIRRTDASVATPSRYQPNGARS